MTIATGFDIGQRSTRDLDALNISAALRAKLMPYAGLRREAAADFLQRYPLTISQGEATELDMAVRETLVQEIETSYDLAIIQTSNSRKFPELCQAARTVIASVTFQYGPRLDRATPKFWQAAIRRDWRTVELVLRDFNDNYLSRRVAEADYLAEGNCQ